MSNKAIYPDDFELMDSKGRLFSSDSSDEFDWKMKNKKDFLPMLNPGQADIFVEIFDIPDDVEITALQCKYIEHVNFKQGEISSDVTKFFLPFKV